MVDKTFPLTSHQNLTVLAGPCYGHEVELPNSGMVRALALPKALFPSFTPRLHSIASPTLAFQIAAQHAGLWTSNSGSRGTRHHTCRKSRQTAARQILGRSLQPPAKLSFFLPSLRNEGLLSRLLQCYRNCFWNYRIISLNCPVYSSKATSCSSKVIFYRSSDQRGLTLAIWAKNTLIPQYITHYHHDISKSGN